MKLKDATKEELIWWITKSGWLPSCDEHQFTVDILSRRSEKASERGRLAGSEYLKALEKYIKLLKPYEGRPLCEIPDKILHHGAALEQKMEKAREKEKRAWADQTRLDKKILLLDESEEFEKC